jgi:N-hydroxyarylamine O-acetyltransferase
VEGLDDLGRYLARLGLGPEPSFFELHRAHVVSIPWDNLDPYSGIPVSLERSRLEDKLVAQGRGGYCFEHNLLFMSALHSIGIEKVGAVLARVRRGDPNVLRPFGHIALRVTTDGRDWLADVGLAQGGLLDPIPMEAGLEHDQSGWRFRLVEDGRELVWQTLEDGEWRDGYGFLPEPAPLVDIEVCNWYTATYPSSPFVTGFIGCHRGIDRSVLVRVRDGSAVLSEQLAGRVPTTTALAIDDVPDLLERRLGLPGIEKGPDDRLKYVGRFDSPESRQPSGQ